MRDWAFAVLVEHRRRILTILAFQLFIAFVVAIQPIYLQRLIGHLIADSSPPSWQPVLELCLLLAGLMAAVAVAQGANGHVAARFSAELLKQLQTAFFDKAAQLPLSYFHHHSFGEFFTRFNHDVGQTQSLLADVIPRLLREGVTGLALFLVIAWFCPWELAVAVVLVTSVSVFLALQCHRVLERYAARQRTLWGEVNKEFDETVRGIDTIKTFGAEERRKERFSRQTEGLMHLSVEAGKVAALFSPLIDLVLRVGSLVLVVIAYNLIAGDALGSDTFLLFFFCAAILQFSAASMIALYTRMPPQLVGVRNLSGYFSAPGEIARVETPQTGGDNATISGPIPIEFKDLHFAWPGGQDLYGGRSFKIPANTITLVRGPNGSGKSTLISLLLRFVQPDSGQIAIGGSRISEFSANELRTKISVVTQYHHVFHDTLRENLLVARPGAREDELLRVLEEVGLGTFLRRLPSGLDQVLEAGGTNLSGGECQRLSIARLLLRDSPILVFDEPWASLDDEVAQAFTEVLTSLARDRTVIVITHQFYEPSIRLGMEIVLGPVEARGPA